MARMAGRPPGSKNKPKEDGKSSERFLQGGENETEKGLERLMEQMVSHIEKKLDNMREEMKENICLQIDKLKNEMIEERRKRDEELKIERDKLRKEKKKLQERIEVLENLNERREKAERKNNIIIKGLEIKSKNVEKEVNDFLENELEAKVEIKKASEIGKGDRKIIIAELEKWEEKKEMMRKKKKLGDRKIFIEHDLTIQEREIQKKLGHIARREREQNKDVKVGFQMLRIQGKWINWIDLQGKVDILDNQETR